MTYDCYGRRDAIPNTAWRRQLGHISVADWLEGMTSPFAPTASYWDAHRVVLVEPNPKYL